MNNTRRFVLGWAEQGHIAESDFPRALEVAGFLPSRAAWRKFLDRLLLWMGVALLASGLIFFIAYNWTALGRFARMLLVEAALAAAILSIVRFGVDRPAGKAALFGASLILGGLLALIGQTYQTGADTFELFAGWAVMILPWVLAGRFPALWLLWVALVNLAVTLYFQTLPTMFGVWFNERTIWVLFAFNSAALAVWDALSARGVSWLSPRWAPRLLATAGGMAVTVLAIRQIMDSYGHDASVWSVPAWVAWLAVLYAAYRRALKDVFMLAGGVLSAIVVVAVFLANLLSHSDAGGFLMVGLVVIGLSSAGGWWLRNVAAEELR